MSDTKQLLEDAIQEHRRFADLKAGAAKRCGELRVQLVKEELGIDIGTIIYHHFRDKDYRIADIRPWANTVEIEANPRRNDGAFGTMKHCIFPSQIESGDYRIKETQE